MAEGGLDRRAPCRWTRVDARWMIEAIGSTAAAQTAVRFDMRNPRGLGNETTRCADPILYFSVGRHEVELSNRDAGPVPGRTSYICSAVTIKNSRSLPDVAIVPGPRPQSPPFVVPTFRELPQAMPADAATHDRDPRKRVTASSQAKAVVECSSASWPSSRRGWA